MMRRQFFVNLITAGTIITINLLYAVTGAGQTHEVYRNGVPGGEIEGYVFDEQGQPVSEATVYALRHNIEKGMIPLAETNENGFFSLIVEPGTYTVYAGKSSAGYPETLHPFYQDSTYPVEIQVNEDQIIDNVILRLGTPSGRLFGRIINASTRNPVSDVNITFRLVSDSSHYFETNVDMDGRFEIVAPSTPFTIEISAEGYENWRYNADELNIQGRALRLASGETRELMVSLRPVR